MFFSTRVVRCRTWQSAWYRSRVWGGFGVPHLTPQPRTLLLFASQATSWHQNRVTTPPIRSWIGMGWPSCTTWEKLFFSEAHAMVPGPTRCRCTPGSSFTAKIWFCHRSGRSLCVHSRSHFIIWLIIFFFKIALPAWARVTGSFYYKASLCSKRTPHLPCTTGVPSQFFFVLRNN